MKRLIGLRASAALIALALGASVLSMPAVAQTAAEDEAKSKAEADGKALREALSSRLNISSADFKLQQSKYPEALALYRSVAATGSSTDSSYANFKLGEMAESGRGVAKDEAEAIRYYKLAAAGGWADGHYALGNIYNANFNYADAETQYRKFTVLPNASSGHKAEARYQLGKIYRRGVGVPQDYAVAGEQFGLAALSGNGHNDARYEFGMGYLEGKGVGQDYAEAAKHFQIAAVYNEAADEPGVVDAQYALGSLYAAGKGVAQSDAEAVKYLRMAAREDHTKAQFGLGMMFAAGKGVPQSISIAYLWIARAAEGDVSTRGLSEISKTAIAGQNGTAQAIQARDSIRTRMTAEQIADAQVLIDRCVASKHACNWGG